MRLLLMCAVGLVAANSVHAKMDQALIGTWQFDGTTAQMFWVVRAGGDYRLHGWGVPVPQRGRFDGKGGKWSVTAPGWQDSGSYQLTDADTWVVTSTLKKRENAYAQAKQTVQAPIAVPGLGADAYAHMTGDTTFVKVLGKNRILTVSLNVTAGSAEHDLPALIELARLIYGRLR